MLAVWNKVATQCLNDDLVGFIFSPVGVHIAAASAYSEVFHLSSDSSFLLSVSIHFDF